MSESLDHTAPPPEHPDLVGLLRGELTNTEVIETGDHLDGCPSCRADLAETAVGHALLSSAGRRLGGAAGDDVRPTGPVAEWPLPPAPAVPRTLTRWARPLGAVAAAAVLVAGTAFVTTSLLEREDAPRTAVAQPQTADLEPVEGSGGGQVLMLDHEGAVNMTVETRDLPRPGKGEFYYVWLFNPETQKMLGLGVLRPDGTGGFEVPDSLLQGYQVVDVSLEKDDGDPAHSVTSVLRGAYAGEDGVASS